MLFLQPFLVNSAFTQVANQAVVTSIDSLINSLIVWHSGGIAGFNAIMMYLPKSKTKIVLLSNTENGIMPIWEALQRNIAAFSGYVF